jgi:hypothetical protein
MVTKHLPSHARRAFRWRLLVAILGLIVLDHFLAPAHAARPRMLAEAPHPAGITAPLR